MHETIQIKRLRVMAARRGWTWTGEPSGFCGRLQIGGRSRFVIGADLGVNPCGAARIARDKAFAQFFLSEAGLPTIPTRVFHSLPEAVSITELPLLLKPNEGHGGQGISVVLSPDELAPAYELARRVNRIVLGQPVIRQREFRVVVFDRGALLAYEKKPLTWIGDGVRTVRELSGADPIADPRIQQRLQQRRLAWHSVLPAGQAFVPLPVANLTAGGTWRECLSELSPAILNAAVAATSALGLVMAGIDLFSEAPACDSLVINEVNASPGFECLAAQEAMLDPLFAAIEAYLGQHTFFI